VVPPDREQFTLLIAGDLGGVGVSDPPDDQPGADLTGFAPGCEGGEGGLGDFGVGDRLFQFFVEDRFGVADLRPSVTRDARDGGGDGAVLAGGDRKVSTAAAGRATTSRP